MGLTVLEVVLGAIASILITISVESLRKPRLQLIVTAPCDLQYPTGPAKQGRFLHVGLVNKPLPRALQWMQRNAALQCHGTIAFHHLDGQKVFERVMSVRWSFSTEPIPIRGYVDGKPIVIWDPTRYVPVTRRDVYPGETETAKLDIGARFDDERDCYGWCNDNYLSNPPWRNPEWRLPAGRYLVRIVVRSSGEECAGVFRLINDVPQSDFRLEPALPDDRVRD